MDPESEAEVTHIEGAWSLSEFQSNADEFIAQMKESGMPRFLTIDGKAEIVVQDAQSYQEILERASRAEAIAGIRSGLESMQRGEGRLAEDALEDIRSRHRIPRQA